MPLFTQTFHVRAATLLAVLVAIMPATASAQAESSLRGHVTDSASGRPVPEVSVSVGGARSVVTDAAGAYLLRGISAGRQSISLRRLGFLPRDTTIDVVPGADVVLQHSMSATAVRLGAVSVTAVSRRPERIVDAPAAVSAVDPEFAEDMAATGQTPLLVANLPGVHAMQSGVYDFNLNARGFNAALSRNVLVLVDGRDVSVPILGNQDWASIAALGEAVRVEMVRGPGSALYGANALSGVLTINSPTLRMAHGNRFSLTAGELATLRLNGSIASLTADWRFAYRLSGGHARSNSYDVSRTNTGDLQREYANTGIVTAGMRVPAPGFELTPLVGQTKATAATAPGAAIGSADPVTTTFGSARADYYPSNGSVVTLEAGQSRIENAVNTTGVGRSQVLRADRPWARLAWTSDAFSVMSYYSGRDGHQVSLGSGTFADDRDAMLHTEGQLNRGFAGARGRVVAGASIRSLTVNSRGTLFTAAQDDRRDSFYATFGQVDFDVAAALRLVVASRLDKSTLDDWQFSPKVALVYKVRADHSVRATYNKGFRAPAPFERFLLFPAGPPLNLLALERGLRASALGPALGGVPNGTLFTNSSAVPLLAVGNEKLRPQEVTSWEMGYKGDIGRTFLTADVYYSRINDFTSGLLTGVNAAYAPWTAPSAVPESARPGLEGAVRAAAAGLTRLPGGASAYVLSYGNEGRATEWGTEISAAAILTDRIQLDANYSLHRWALEGATLFAADTVLSNTPRHTVNAGVAFHGRGGFRARAGFRFDDTFQYKDYQWSGRVPATRTIDVTITRPLGNALTLGVVATNLLDEQRFQMYGGSVIGRRALATLHWKP